jgi:hypothetical protein
MKRNKEKPETSRSADGRGWAPMRKVNFRPKTIRNKNRRLLIATKLHETHERGNGEGQAKEAKGPGDGENLVFMLERADSDSFRILPGVLVLRYKK